jgi:replication factor C subunit 2/4
MLIFKKNININYIMNKVPWIEKYRPHKINEIVMDDVISREINNIIKNKDIPNMILTGTPGIGKTTTILCLARELYGPYVNDAVLELNASDDRGIQSINTSVINFCNYLLPYKDDQKSTYSKQKLIIFDEADNMTDKALPIISMLMDKYHDSTRFVFTCNVSSKIIESIQSRCKILRFSRLPVDFIIKRLAEICKLEKVKFKKNALEEISLISGGDLRSAINLLQLTSDKFELINSENVSSTCDKPSATLIKNIIVDCINKKLVEAIKKTYELKEKGFTGADIINNSFNVMRLHISNDIKEEIKMKIFSIISEYMYKISKTMDTDILLTSFLIEMNELK